MIDLILRGPPWTEEEWQAILDYCAGDVYALERLLPAMLPYIDLPRALFRGRYMGNRGSGGKLRRPRRCPCASRSRGNTGRTFKTS